MKQHSSVAIVGAGPAGLAAAKIAQERGYHVQVFERLPDIGGIWNPEGHGAYDSVRMQTSRYAFHYSDFGPAEGSADFLTREDFYNYLRAYRDNFGLSRSIRSGTNVVQILKEGGHWTVISTSQGEVFKRERFDRIVVANGELWRPKMLPIAGSPPLTAKDYRDQKPFADLKVLVIGGGVSGADIAAEIAGAAREVHWSVRHRALLLPRMWGDTVNDGCFSYLGRYEVQRWPRKQYLSFLHECMPKYMAQYEQAGLLPDRLSNNAIHVNDTAVPAVASGTLQVRSGVACIDHGRRVYFQDGSTSDYDRVVVCAGYEPPDYGFIQGFAPCDLYEDFFYREDPTLAVLNTPPTADGYGTACPYFEAIAHWIFQVFDENRSLPEHAEMQQWCEARANKPFQKAFYDCWLEGIRIGLLSGQIPSPVENFSAYWKIVASGVTPFNLSCNPSSDWKPQHDSLVDLDGLRLRLLKGLPRRTLQALVQDGVTSKLEAERVDRLPALPIHPGLCE